MMTTTREDASTGHSAWPLLRLCAASVWLMAMLAGCGGGSGSESAPGPTSDDLSAASGATLESTLDLATNRVTLQWSPTFTTTSRYQVEEQDSSGAWVVIGGAWGASFTSPIRWTGGLSGTTTLRVEAVRSGYAVPLKTRGSSQSTSITVAAPAPIPSIELDQSEPLENPTGVSLSNAGAYTAVNYAVDTWNQQFTEFEGPQPPDYAVTWDPSDYTTGTHRLYALLQLSDSSRAVVSRSVRSHSSKAATQIVSTRLNPGSFAADVIATSDSGITSVVATMNGNGMPLETLAAPNACLPLPCAAGQPFNAYHLSVDTKSLASGYQTLLVSVTDNSGNLARDYSSFTLPAPGNATLDSPLDGAVVAGSMHISGTFWAGATGALEVLVELSGVMVYDTTVANPGIPVPYSADVSLAGVAPGSHTLSVFSRVGDTTYLEAASVVIQVAAAP